jgi:hypothetical protein
MRKTARPPAGMEPESIHGPLRLNRWGPGIHLSWMSAALGRLAGPSMIRKASSYPSFTRNQPGNLVALDEALDALAKHDPRRAKVVEMRFCRRPERRGDCRRARDIGRERAARQAAGEGLARARAESLRLVWTPIAGARSKHCMKPRWQSSPAAAPPSSKKAVPARIAYGRRSSSSCATTRSECRALSGGVRTAGNRTAYLSLRDARGTRKRRHGCRLSRLRLRPSAARGPQGAGVEPSARR